MPLIIVILGIALLLVLIMKLKLNTFVSLIIVSFFVALALGMPLSKIIKSIEAGLGGTLGHIALIFGLGAMLGKVISDSGGAQKIAITLIRVFGKDKIQWAVVIAAFVVGIALFYEVGLVLLIPIVFTMARQMNISILYLGVPMCAALSTAHAFLPPHPGPTVIAGEYGADIGTVLVYGILISIPTIIIFGPIYNNFAKRVAPSLYMRTGNIESLGEQRQFEDHEMPGFKISVLTAMLPVLIMFMATIILMLQTRFSLSDSAFFRVIKLLGDASVAMVISLLFALFTMGLCRKKTMTELMKSCSISISNIGMMLLIIGGGGAFKQVLIDGGVGQYISSLFSGVDASPLIFAWGVAALLRLSLGSSTVAAISTAGLVIPMLQQNPDTNLALVTLATGAGSLFASHVNDAGFWMFKEYFGLSIKENFGIWTTLCCGISISGLIGVLILNTII